MSLPAFSSLISVFTGVSVRSSVTVPLWSVNSSRGILPTRTVPISRVWCWSLSLHNKGSRQVTCGCAADGRGLHMAQGTRVPTQWSEVMVSWSPPLLPPPLPPHSHHHSCTLHYVLPLLQTPSLKLAFCCYHPNYIIHLKLNSTVTKLLRQYRCE